MLNLLFIWSPLIFIFLLSLFSSMSIFNHSPNALRIVGAVILLPSAISTIFLFKLTYASWMILGKNWSIIPIDLRVFYSSESAILLGFYTFSLIAALFLLPSNKLVNTIKLMSITYLLWLLIALPVHWFIFMSLFSMGSIIISYHIIREAELNAPDNDKESLFLSQRLSDLLAFTSLCFILANQKTLSLLELPRLASQISLSSLVIFFLALIVRLAPLSRKRVATSFAQFRVFYIEDAFVAIGTLVILLRLKEVVFYHEEANYLLIAACTLIILRTSFIVLQKNLDIFLSANSLLSCAAIILMCFEELQIAEVILYLLVLLMPITLYMAAQQNYSLRAKIKSEARFDPLLHLGSLLARLVTFSAEASVKFISPFYTNFILYRLPQFLVTILQIPLRIFHNGSIKRSLLFIIVSLTAYYWWWG